MLATFPSSASDARLPRYQQLRDAVTSQIAAGVWKPGDAIPAEQSLAETYGLALGTVRKALDALVAEGLLEKRQGRGTFVRRAEFSNSLFRFFRLHDEEGRQAIPEGRVLARKRVPASPDAAVRLGLAPGAPTIRISRLRLVEGKPLLVEDIWLPADRFTALMDLRPAGFSDLLYPLYEELCGQLIASAEETLSIEPVDAANARLLDLEVGTPVVVIERVARSYDHQPLEWRRSRGPADRFHYRVEIR